MLTLPDKPDALGVLSSTLPVVEQARSVRIDLDHVERLAAELAHRDVPPLEWASDLHWSGGSEATANYVLVLDALNFSFWGEPRWVVMYRGRAYNGYWALAAAVKRALEEGVPLTDARYLAAIDEATLSTVLAGEHTIPLLPQRAENLRQCGRLLQERYAGQFSDFIQQAGGSAISLVHRVVSELPSFNDVSAYQEPEVRFYKRAQILVADLAGAFRVEGLGSFHDLDQLTAFADYKVPQVLQHLGILAYDDELRERLRRHIEIPPGGPLELEIRAATIWAVEALRAALAHLGRQIPPYQLDWLLWELGQDLPIGVLPYHRTRTIFY